MNTVGRGDVDSYGGAEKVSRRKRHIPVNTFGLLLKLDVHAVAIKNRGGAPAGSALPRLRRVRAGVGYCNRAGECIKEKLSRAVEIVKRPSKWGRCLIDTESPPMTR